MKHLIKKILNESVESDFGWAEDMLNNVPDISIGDVIYIVDDGSTAITTTLPLDYQPKNVRYLFIIKNVSENGDIIRQDCNPMNVVYNKEYYKDRCSDGREEYTDFELSLKLLNKHYWRKM